MLTDKSIYINQKEMNKKNTNNEDSIDKTKVILDAAIQVFADKGYFGARVSDIAKEAGIAYGLVYHYFDSKEELLISIFRTRWTNFIDALETVIASEKDPQEMVRKIISFLFNSYKNNPSMVEVMIMDVAKTSRFFNDENIHHFKDAFKLITKIVEMGQEKGLFHQQTDATLAAYAIYGSVERIMLHWILDDMKSISQEEINSATDMLTATLLNGLVVCPKNS